MSAEQMRIRITFSKTQAMRYTGHLDLHRAWERAFRRSCLPLAYSLGFHPQPKLNLAAALPLGFTSDCELLDAWLETVLPVEQVMQALVPALPPGMLIHTIEQVDLRLPALQTQVTAADYEVTLLEPLPGLAQRVEHLLGQTTLPRQRRGKDYDLRPLIEAIDLLAEAGPGPHLRMRLSLREAATGRPEEVLDALGASPASARVRRIRMLMR